MASLDGAVNGKKNGTENGNNFIVLEKQPKRLSLCIKDENKSEEDTVMFTPIPEKAEEEVALQQTNCEVSIYWPKYNSLIIKVVPPTEPVANQRHRPVEIVLLIDVSFSMNELAPVPPSGEGEQSEQIGFTVLDLTKHAACTIAEGINEHDTLCIVTFSTVCRVRTFLA
jgi:hypothetical protein